MSNVLSEPVRPRTDGATFEEVPCPRCGSSEAVRRLAGRDHLYGVPGEYYVSACSQCDFWFQNPRPRPEALAGLYPAHYGPHGEAAAAGEPSLREGTARFLRREFGYSNLGGDGGKDWTSTRLLNPYRRWGNGVALVPRYIPGGRLLDLGCGAGTMLKFLRRLGWEHLHGIELVPEAAARAVGQGFDVRCGPLERELGAFPDGHFDVVLSTMVLEHLRDPFAVTRAVAAKLKPGGQFLFSTVVREGVDQRWFGPYWAGYDLPRHLAYFRKRDLSDMLAADFEGIEWFHQSAPIDFLRSASWRKTPLDRLVLRLGTRGLAPLSLALAWAGKTTRVSVRCRRRTA